MGRRTVQTLAFIAALALASPALADFDAARDAGEEVVEIVTYDEDGSPRKTKIWIVAVGGVGYVRTGATNWGRNVERNADVRILTAAGDHDLRVQVVTDEATRGAVIDAFRAKYGWSDRLISPFRGPNPKILRLVERSPAP